MAVVNRYNFLRWSDQVSTGSVAGDFLEEDFDADDFLTTVATGLSVEDLGDLPRPYALDRERCGSMPILYPADTFGFYINTKTGLALGAFSDLRMRMIDVFGNEIVSGFATLYQDVISGGNYNVYSVFTVPAIPTGLMRLQIYRNSDATVLLTSNLLWSRYDDDVRHQTLIARFRNDRQFYNFRYQTATGFYQQFRLSINVIERLYESDKENYTEVTTGKPRTLNAFLKRYYKFETYYFDPPAHEACAVMIEHDHVEFNGMRFRTKTPYRESNDPLMLIGKGEFEMYDEDYAQVNRCGVDPVLVMGDGAGGALGTGGADEILGAG